MPPPVVHRPARGPLRLSRYIGYRVLHSGLPSRVRIQKVNRAGEYDGWAVARTHLSAVVRVIAEHYGACLVVLEYRRIGKCTVACQTAREDTVAECVCVCGGSGHASGPVGRTVTSDGLVVIDEGTTQREVNVRRGQTLEAVLYNLLHN